MASAAQQAIVARLEALELFRNRNKLVDPSPGMGDRNIARTVLDMETHVDALVRNAPVQASNVNAIVEKKMREEVDKIIHSKLKTALHLSRGGDREDGNSWYTSVLESKAAQGIGSVIDATHCRQLNKKIKHALDQTRLNSRIALDRVSNN